MRVVDFSVKSAKNKTNLPWMQKTVFIKMPGAKSRIYSLISLKS